MENRPQNEVYDCRQEKSAHTPRNQERTEPDVSFRTFKSVNQEKESYKKIGERIKNLGKPVFSVLEGGYSEDLPECIYEYLQGAMD